MFNIGAGEFLVILVIALVVLGPERLPEAIRKVGQVMGELRKLSAGFQDELRDAMNEPLEEMRSTVDMVRNPFRDGEEPASQTTEAPPVEPAPTSPPIEVRPPADTGVEPPSGSSPLSS
ncbi:MAG: Sec-independent protein translocase protein TatB [Acidimicrobiales bacterium]